MVFIGEKRVNRFSRQVCTIRDVEGVDWDAKTVKSDAVVVYTIGDDPWEYRWALYGMVDLMPFEEVWNVSVVGLSC